jgi:hypothetical protein
MTKELARDILWNFCKEKTKHGKDLPIYGERVTTTYENNVLATWTFRGLLKYIYELEDKNL